ncbi:DUF1330 domain-containing protein [Pseudoroseicyclus aestuarii]|uniref:Uncharacterized protein (DUF1330 family) n=1 Tax=Pseudoroseicyclus aestuarii TaxID=1795041 RepID=A0A318SZZ5_9RHOB|nr:DUF1330 domain-containing protein [Pseudoroseicyclus aestuarii]PYE85949.1 uncharacterized protein (DUF1330 family) [Pseudoroseicyclus aestuarii]
MPAALWIAHSRVSDDAAYGEYAKRATGAIEAHGGSFIARGGRYVQLEGQDSPRNVVIRFASLEAAQACYDSAEYQEALSYAKGAAERDVVIVEIND